MDAPLDERTEAMLLAIPKVSLHNHLIGAVSARTVLDLAKKHGVTVEGGRDEASLYDHGSYEDLDEFLRVLDVAGSVMRDHDDFRRVAYETLTDGGAALGVVHREIFLSPPGHPGVPYRTIIEGVREGMREAEADTGITSRMIVGLCRNDTAASAVELVEEIIANPMDEVIGIGLDYSELIGPPARFVEAFQLAGRAGLRRTAHSESGPPAHVEVILDQLGGERIDHGYHVVDDERITRRCVEERIPFTCTPVSSDIGRYSGSGDGSHRRIAQMVDAGLLVTIDSDDPPMFGTDAVNDYRALARALGYGRAQFERFTWNAVEASWLDATDKLALTRRVQQKLDAL
ncbi:adenosine deaminase [Microbacterium sediminicola]|uniref:Adenosine deaminase n=1 Tax=Microbacterium sediminicola TaxID=415210 RepID=A0ABN2I8M0_9MICO